MLILSTFFKLKKTSQFSLLLVGGEKQFCCPGLRLPKFLGYLSSLLCFQINQLLSDLFLLVFYHIQFVTTSSHDQHSASKSPCPSSHVHEVFYLFYFCLPILDMWPCCQVFCQHITWVTTVWLLLLSLYYVLMELKATAPCLRQYSTSSTSFHMRQVIILPSTTPTSQWIK